jgi:hydroxymethylpyrimidine/phosphomethylpyrimidine kinase
MKPEACASVPVALTIAGSDSSGGAGIQADLKTFQALGVFGMSAITAVTVQNTQKVYAVHAIPPDIVYDQVVCLFEDTPIQAVKIGMVASAALIEAVSAALVKVQCPVVVLDPVMTSKSGHDLLDLDGRRALTARLFPMATVVTPNIPETEILIGGAIRDEAQMRTAARKIIELGVPNVVIKGGHLDGAQAVDIVFDGNRFETLTGRRIATRNTHGTGCTFSSAIAAYQARGCGFFEAARRAKQYVTGAIAHGLSIGKGHGPTHHFYDLYARAGVCYSLER